MKRPFAVLLLNPLDADAVVKQHKNPSYGELLELGAIHGMLLLSDDVLNVNGHQGNGVLDRVDPATIFLIGGSPSAELLLSALDELFKREMDAMIVINALETRAELHSTFVDLNRKRVQMVKLKEAEAMIDAPRLMMYAYPKADTTATTMVFLDWYTDNPLVLTIERLHDPFQGHESAPGGYLDVLLETVGGCAVREVTEETSLDAGKLELIDVRSEPDRDPRGHVIDHGYAWFVPKRLRNRVFKAVKAGDDAKPGSAHFKPVKAMRKRTLGFDHNQLFNAAVKRMHERRRQYERRSRAAKFPNDRVRAV